MDQILADTTGVSAAPGDEAVLIGRQGTEELFARDLAGQANTIAWDIFTGLGPGEADLSLKPPRLSVEGE